MPSLEELNAYYEKEFWDEKRGKVKFINKRDLAHANIIKNHFGRLSDSESSLFVNFGAGHGGISHLMHLFGLEVVNIDPSELLSEYSGGFEYYSSLARYKQATNRKVDIFYSSHSLEHVQDISTTLRLISGITTDKTLFFFEVPDANSPGNGAQKGKVDIPHTYYFTKKFFSEHFRSISMLASFCYENREDIDAPFVSDIAYNNDQKGVIRCLASGLIFRD